MKHLLLAILLIPSLSFGQATRDVQKKASRQTANVASLTSDLALGYLDAETQLLTPTANRIVTLPSANVWKAWSVKIVNEDTTSTLTIKSSDGTTLDTLAAVGQAQYVARQATPTGSAHWTNLSKIGVLGVTDGSSACAGCVGESARVFGSGTPAMANSNQTVAVSTSLPAGEYDVSCLVSINASTNSIYSVSASVNDGVTNVLGQLIDFKHTAVAYGNDSFRLMSGPARFKANVSRTYYCYSILYYDGAGSPTINGSASYLQWERVR